MSYTNTQIHPQIRRVLTRLDYTVDALGTVYLSIEEGGQPIGSLAEVAELAEAFGCLDQPTTQSLIQLDRALWARANRLVAA